ncbi:IclR family transcriptional regulator, pca regulon regulatory protein [Saccharopolyspora antimicrobica]|uniref:Glycerol operon regulatory protein n=1 Tax=Saccharopolyspora antimicrobica TaxID=455193 RepID=A0A1I5EGF3_9PSEU|nr:IclR family transcriptional regulator C-terminal domain-containing protein [Saccharopolyspora antimicrobica]RKT86804.1 IclR family transcriptional regulator [Saccharopolyspora antimicrobica]SFO10460.1 IclR family transcriptional regulator, pca regulon regulatory protein [Saccharopolyspora antimicrobica]
MPEEQVLRSVERTLAVLRAFSPEQPEMTLTEVAQASGLDRAGARRILLSLVHLGYVRHDERRFALTPQVLEFGHAYLSSRSLPQIAEPHLRRLTRELREMTALAVLDGDEIRYVAQVPSPKLLSVTIPVGTRFPAHATSMGKVLLAGMSPELLEARLRSAELKQLTPHTVTTRERLLADLAGIREQGFAISDNELEEGLRGVAAPVRDSDGKVIAAVNVSLDAHRAPEGAVRREIVPLLVTTASRIEADLRLKPPAGHQK